MENDSVKLKIHYDIQEKKVLKRWNVGLLIISILVIFLMVKFIDINYSFISIFIATLLFSEIWRNFYILKVVKCPSCRSKYFHPFLASKDEIKSLLKSNPKCVNCNYEAEIISEYKTMY